MVSASGGEPTSLVMVDEDAPGVAYFGMKWTADGQHLYYSVHYPKADDPANGVYRYNQADGSSRQVLSPSPELGGPAVLQVGPTGKHVLIWYPLVVGSFDPQSPFFWLFGVETGDVTPIEVPSVDTEVIGRVAAVGFSPDGEFVLAATVNTTPDFQLWVTETATGDQTQLVESLPGVMPMEYSLPLSWSASGHIFVPADFGSGTLLTVEPRTVPEVGTPVAVTGTPEATPESGWEGVTTGQVVQIASQGVPLHAAPSATAPAVLLLDQGAEVTVIGPPEVVVGVVWIPVQDAATRTVGFVRAEFVSQ
jgi:hypothetical protein